MEEKNIEYEDLSPIKDMPQTTPEGLSETVSVKSWILFWCLSIMNIVPIIGTIAYLGILGYVGFAKDTKYSQSLRNFCKSYLIIFAITVLFFIVAFYQFVMVASLFV